MVRCACGLEAVIRTSWTNRNPGRHFYGCPTLVMGYGIVDEFGFELIDGMNSLCFSHIVDALSKFRTAARSTARLFLHEDVKGEFEQCLPTNVMAYKTREELKGLQKDDMIKAMAMRMIALQLHL
ncbi:zinc finger, GRF-type containing protein [Tanacetum coccineum]